MIINVFFWMVLQMCYKMTLLNDPYDGGAIGAFQPDAFAKHGHELTDGINRITTIRSRPGSATTEGSGTDNLNLQTGNANNAPTRTSWIQPAGGKETTPAWIGVFVCIRY
jgi:hypothetical protein